MKLFEIRKYINGGPNDRGELLCYVYDIDSKSALRKASTELGDELIVKYPSFYIAKEIPQLPNYPPIFK